MPRFAHWNGARKRREANRSIGRECFTGLALQSNPDQSLVRRLHVQVHCYLTSVSVCHCVCMWKCISVSGVPYLLSNGAVARKSIFRWLVVCPTEKVTVLQLTELHCELFHRDTIWLPDLFIYFDRRNNCLPWASLLFCEVFLIFYKHW
jgi:hypothetical protein